MAVAFAWGQLAIADIPRTYVEAAPLSARWWWNPRWELVPAMVVGAALVAGAPVVAARARWSVLLGSCAAGAIGWSVALAAAGGWSAVTQPLASRHEPLVIVADIESSLTFLRTFTDRLVDYPIHVKGHPPGIVLVYWVLDRAGLAGPGWATALVLLALAVMVVAVLVTARLVAGEALARRAAPFLAAAPFAVWATSTDPIYGAAIAAGTALLTAAITHARLLLAVVAGVVLALALHLTYGAVPLLLIPGAIVVLHRAWPTAFAAAAGACAVTVGFVVAGFWWFDGLALTRAFYEAGVADRRPYAYFALAGNPGALALALGPAAAAGIARLRDRHAWVLVGAALVAVVVADLSGLSKAEVERIWIPFMPWLLLASSAAASSRRASRWWLAAQVLLAVVLELSLRTPW